MVVLSVVMLGYAGTRSLASESSARAVPVASASGPDQSRLAPAPSAGEAGPSASPAAEPSGPADVNTSGGSEIGAEVAAEPPAEAPAPADPGMPEVGTPVPPPATPEDSPPGLPEAPPPGVAAPGATAPDPTAPPEAPAPAAPPVPPVPAPDNATTGLPPVGRFAAVGVRYTVVLLTSDSLAAAEELVRRAAGAGLSASLLETDGFANLRGGLFVAVVGSFAAYSEAERHAAEVGRRGLPVESFIEVAPPGSDPPPAEARAPASASG